MIPRCKILSYGNQYDLENMINELMDDFEIINITYSIAEVREYANTRKTIYSALIIFKDKTKGE